VGQETGTSYATDRDLFMCGIPSAALAHSPRQAKTVDATTNRLLVRAHGLSNDDQVLVESTGTMPGGLSATTVYFARVVSFDLLELATTAGGAAVDISSAGTGVVSVVPQTTSEQIALILEQVSREVDNVLRANAGPLVKWPSLVTSVVARIAAHRLAAVKYKETPIGEALRFEAEAAQKTLDGWRKGAPLDVLTEDATPRVADAGAAGFSAEDEQAVSPL
jgi:hypothetical protein